MPADWQKTRVAKQAFQFPNSGIGLALSVACTSWDEQSSGVCAYASGLQMVTISRGAAALGFVIGRLFQLPGN